MAAKKNNKNLKYIALSILGAIFVLCVNYVLNNTPLPIFDDISFYSVLEKWRRGVTTECPQDSDVLFINVAYDKKVIPYSTDEGLPLGNIDITDRAKLYRFFKLAKQCDNYKYIFMDVRFEKGLEDYSLIEEQGDSLSVDSLLFSAIGSTPRLVVSKHENMVPLTESIASKTATNDYKSTITSTNFVRYRYLYDEGESVALKMFMDIDSGEYNKHGLIYTTNGKLCSNCPFIAFKTPFKYERENEGELSYYNLGEDILTVYDDESLAELIRDKYIVIADFVEDTHDTYVGPQPGAYITYMAYKQMVEGKNIYRWWMMLLFGLVYGVATFVSLSNFDMWSKIPLVKKSKSRTLHFLLTFVGFSLCMSVISAGLYLVCGVAFSIWFPSIYFTGLKTINSYLQS